MVPPESYAARLEIDYLEKLDRFTTLFRVIWIIPIFVVLAALFASVSETVTAEDNGVITTTGRSGGGIASGLCSSTWLELADGDFEYRLTPCCWSRTSTRLSASDELKGR